MDKRSPLAGHPGPLGGHAAPLGCHPGLDPGSTLRRSGWWQGRDGLRVKPAMTALGLLVFGLTAFAQSTPVGLWRNIDDKTGEAKAEIRISESAGVLSGSIVKRLTKEAKPDAVCEECKDERKGKPMDGLEIIRGARKAPEGNVWEGGKILDPENGREYTLKLTPQDGGRKLDVRGSFGPFGRTQTWVRVQ
jgi:uncharacterized protein (DUF2147 family)